MDAGSHVDDAGESYPHIDEDGEITKTTQTCDVDVLSDLGGAVV
jgi:hypothetical protein